MKLQNLGISAKAAPFAASRALFSKNALWCALESVQIICLKVMYALILHKIGFK